MVRSLASKLLSIIESSICVPNDLGSSAIVTPVPKTPVDDAPMQLDRNRNKNRLIKILILNFNTIFINFRFRNFTFII